MDYSIPNPTIGVERTSCNCERCKIACHCMPGYLAPSDLPHFSDHSKLRRSQGASVVRGGNIIDLPTIVPAQRPDGACVFLENGHCTVWENSPYGCRAFSVCDTDDDSEKRMAGVIELWNSHEAKDEYHQLTETLEPAAPRQQRMNTFMKALMEIEDRD